MLQISVLGPAEVRRDGRAVRVPGGKTSELLVRLALDAGVPVSVDRLIEELWAPDALTTQRNTVQSKVSRLRKVMGERSVVAVGDGYKLDVERSAVDALAVIDAATAAAGVLADGDDHAAVEICTQALLLFAGEPLAGAGEGDWVAPHRARLQEARLRLVQVRAVALARHGDQGAAIGALEAAVAEFPFQEALWEHLVTSLYRAGRQADALDAYQRVRARLADELGLEPGPRLRALEQQVLSHTIPLDEPGARDRSPDGRGAVGNLPAMSIELIGRGPEVAALAELVAKQRIVEIVGPGGVGKTAVAIELGRVLAATPGAAPGGVWLTRLETTATRDEVIDAVVAALGVSGEAALLDRLRARACVVILDNCEHVVDAAAALAVQLLDFAPGLTLVCTSQIPLGVDAETVFELAPLALEDACELFMHRARAQRAGRHLDGDPAAVHELCRALDGLPLAIELAAARTRTLSIGDITRRLDDRFSILHDPTSRRPERRRALKATIGWSYDLLFPDDQRGLWALATFAGGTRLDAVESVLGALDVPSSTAMDVVERLVARSLVIVDDHDGSPPRFRLLDSIRAFALDAIGDDRDAHQARAAHARWFAAMATTSTAGVRSARQAEHLASARAERPNLDVALAWTARHDPPMGLEIANGFGWAWIVLGDSRGAQRILAALDAVGEAAPLHQRALALLLASWIEASTGDLRLAREHIAQAQAQAESLGARDLQARCAYSLAYVVSHDGDFAHGLALTERSRRLLDELELPWDQAANGLFEARAATSGGDASAAAAALARVQGWLRAVDDPWLHVRFDAALGELARLERRFDDAVHHIGRAAAASQRLGFRQTEAYQVASLGRAQWQAGDYEAGTATLERAVGLAEATGDLRMAALASVHLGRVLRAQGVTDRARVALEWASHWHRQAGGGEQVALGECLLAALDAAERMPGAEARLAAALAGARADHDAHVEVFALDALARAAVGAGDVDRARTLAAAADKRMVVAAHFITERDRVDARAVTGPA